MKNACTEPKYAHSWDQKLGKHVMQYLIANHWLLLKQLQFVYVQCLTTILISLHSPCLWRKWTSATSTICLYQDVQLCLSGFGIARLIDLLQWCRPVQSFDGLPCLWVLLSLYWVTPPWSHHCVTYPLQPTLAKEVTFRTLESLCLHRASEVLYHPSHHHCNNKKPIVLDGGLWPSMCSALIGTLSMKSMFMGFGGYCCLQEEVWNACKRMKWWEIIAHMVCYLQYYHHRRCWR